MSNKTTKRQLLGSIISLVLCCAMLLGTTFAWFTDSVTNTGNRILAGNLEVDLLMHDGIEYKSIADGKGDIFTEAAIAQDSNSTLWEPGKTQIVYLAVENKGNLALKYNIILDIIDGGLIGALEYAIIDGAEAGDVTETSWVDIKARADVQTGDVAAGKIVAAPNGTLDEIVNGVKNERDYFALAVHMKEEAGNEYEEKNIIIDVLVNATQVEAEEDSFDNQYDKDAFVADYYVKTADEMIEAIEAAGQGDVIGLMNDINIDPANMSNAYGTTGINIKNGQTLDGNGYTLDIKGAGGTWDSGINTTGGTIRNLKVTGSFRGIFVNHNSTHSEPVILENVVIDGTVYTISCDQGKNQNLIATNCTFKGWTSFAATLGNATFNNCTFGEGSGYAYCRPYAPTAFVGCTFEEGFEMDARATVTFENCTIGGVALTADNLSTLVTSNTANASVE